MVAISFRRVNIGAAKTGDEHHLLRLPLEILEANACFESRAFAAELPLDFD